MLDIEETSLKVLAQAVRAAVGDADAQPRPGQKALCQQIAATMEKRTTLASEAPTGSGKTFAYLAPAMVMAVQAGDRTVVSTGSLALQSQIIAKDAPVVANAVREVLGTEPKVAVLKGWGNYACVLSAVGENQGGIAEIAEHALDPLARWSIQQALTEGSGDRAEVPFPVTNDQWDTVAVKSQECVGVEKCRFGSVCLPAKARMAVAEADIVVTNHSLLAIQAATSATVVFGNQKLGDFSHLVVDEAHGLASAVRNQGQVGLNGNRLLATGLRLETMLGDDSGFASTANQLAAVLDDAITRCPPGKVPGAEVLAPLRRWVASALRSVRPLRDLAGPTSQVKWWRLTSRLETLADHLTVLATARDDHAYWIEDGQWKASPVDVGGMLIANVYTNGEDDPMSVSLVSATLPQGVASDAGIYTQVRKHPSPFARAYEHSLMYVPESGPMAQKGGRLTLDLAAHTTWAAGEIVELVEANGGSALVLATTSAAGREYVSALRKKLGRKYEIFSQWDGVSTHQLVAKWREDQSAVLVGTRSLMTGVDAPGDTCSLVVVDRVPRSPANPVDQARSAAISKRAGYDRWTADRLVYVTDAALLLEQAAGRLIRSANDSGVLAVLDPRLSKYSPARYPEPTRRMLLGALELFTTRTRDKTEVLNQLQRNASGSGAVARSSEPQVGAA